VNKKDILLKFHQNLFHIKEDLDKEMNWFMIESIGTINIILPHVFCLANYNDFIKEKIFIHGIIFNSNKEFITNILKDLHKLKDIDDIKIISWILALIQKKIITYIEKDKVDSLFSELTECIIWIEKDYVKEFISLNPWKGWHDLFALIDEEQKLKNITPNINKEDFLEKYPDFLEAIDKDGLVIISNLEIDWQKEWVYYKDFFIYYDDLFLELWIHQSFISEYFAFFDKQPNNTTFRIKLNLNKIISKSNYKILMLMWWMYFWPEFSIDKFFTQSENTLFTRKQRLNKWFDTHYGNKLIYTDFYIDQINNSFLIEEIWENKYGNFYLNRLIHSEFNIDKEKIEHFDGSILFYKEENMKDRQNVLLSAYPKLSSKKNKLFRIDGEIDFINYRDILLWFYDWNEMILEYFDLNEYKEKYKNILDYENWVDY